MVHIIKIALLASAAILPALAAPLNADIDEIIAREPTPRRGGGVRRVFNTVNNVVSGISSTATRVGAAAKQVGSVVSTIRGLFGRELEPEEELFLRDLLEDFYARGPEDFDDLDARELDDVEAREVFDEELD